MIMAKTAVLNKLKREIDPLIEPVLFETNHDPSGFLNQIFKTGRVVSISAMWLWPFH